MDKSFTQFNFTAQEHPTSIKWNNILSVMEEHRRLNGPISVAAATSGTNTTALYHMKLVDHPNELGGITTGPCTRATFTIYYNTWQDDPTSSAGSAIFTNVHFTSGDSDWAYEWYAQLNASNLASGTIGIGGVDLSTVNITGFTCIREPYTTGVR